MPELQSIEPNATAHEKSDFLVSEICIEGSDPTLEGQKEMTLLWKLMQGNLLAPGGKLDEPRPQGACDEDKQRSPKLVPVSPPLKAKSHKIPKQGQSTPEADESKATIDEGGSIPLKWLAAPTDEHTFTAAFKQEPYKNSSKSWLSDVSEAPPGESGNETLFTISPQTLFTNEPSAPEISEPQPKSAMWLDAEQNSTHEPSDLSERSLDESSLQEPGVELYDRVQVLPGQNFVNAKGVEYYREGDQGTVVRMEGNPGDTSCIQIIWDRSGRASGMKKVGLTSRVKILGQSEDVGVKWRVRLESGERYLQVRETPSLSSRSICRYYPGNICTQCGPCVNLNGVTRLPIKPEGWITLDATAVGGPLLLERVQGSVGETKESGYQ